MPESFQRLLKVRRCLFVRRSSGRLPTSFMEISHSFIPHLASKRMVGKPLHLFGQAIRIESFNSLDDPGMENTPPFLKEAPVGDLVGQRMLEGVFELGEETRLVNKFSGLKMCKSLAQSLICFLYDGLQEEERNILTDDRCWLKKVLFLRWEPINSG